ncbi:S8 family serine peptidase [Limnohabitans sp. 2KL-1]|uniref:S8 family serine peptidase n=1 Tax=Limnohabitans sp. 2KL-1 TaxID=1100699 RepID=UPI000D361F9B|nr:S8 family serine peptidase [Limnohabitans sp. 2KL-1]
MTNTFRPTDVLYSSQWHFSQIGQLGFRAGLSTQGIERVWRDTTGVGVAVGIWDDGVQVSHWDLNANFDATKRVTVSGQLNTGLPMTTEDGHGTAVAGLIAAAHNGQGGVGVAFDARVTPVRIFGGADDINNAWSRYLTTLDSLGQFDVTNHSYGGFPSFYAYEDVSKFAAASVSGRAGLGTINVKSAGNDNVDGNGDALDASRHTVTVAALDASGNAAWYSTYGAHVLISASAGAVTTDLLGSNAGYDGLLNGDYTDQFGGTSASGPVTAGVIALMLDANAGLGWRDVQNILAYSATGTGSIYGGASGNENNFWKWSGAKNWNGGGLHYSEDYGYGMVNAFNAVRMAEVWRILYPVASTTSNEMSVTTGALTINRAIADLNTLSYAFSVASNLELEHVSLTLSLKHTDLTDLRISLVSPSGTRMSLYDGTTGLSSTSDYGLTYTFGLDGLRGELATGKWTLDIRDAVRRDSGTLQTVTLTGYGTAAAVDDVYHYTDEVLYLLTQNGQAGRIALKDTDGGEDWINASAMYRNLQLDLRPGLSSLAGGTAFLRIDNTSWIENAIGGDGNDTIRGNTNNNLLYGMRGNDTLYGDAGTDTAGFWGSVMDYEVTSLDGMTTVFHRDSGSTDWLYGFEWLKFDDVLMADLSAQTEPEPPVPPPVTGTTGADNLSGTAGDDVLMGLAGNDTLQGNAGNDILDGGADNDTMRGGQGDDVYVIDSRRDVVIEFGNEGIDSLSTTLASYTLGNEVENLSYTGLAAFTGNGNSLANLLEGGGGKDRLSGLAGHDVLNGHAGDDMLIGGLGNDSLHGGDGKDIFRFESALNAATNTDLIADFTSGVDQIQLENATFKALRNAGVLPASSFVQGMNALAKDANDYIIYDTTAGKLYYDGDGSGKTLPILFATLTGMPSLSSTDFLIT